MIIKNISNGLELEHIKLNPTTKVYSSNANESEVETVFENYLKDIGYGVVGQLYTKRTARGKANVFPSKTGSKSGYPDYVFYESQYSDRIIAIGDLKKPDSKGSDNSIVGLNECTNIYIKDYNKKHKEKITIAFGYDGFNFIIKWLDIEKDEWLDIKIDNEPLTVMPQLEFLKSIASYGGNFSTQIEKNISKDLLEPYFAQCDKIFRQSSNSLSAIDKASEISVFIFLKIFSADKMDSEFARQNGCSVWQLLENGNITLINKLFREFLNKQYENVFPEKLIKVSEQSAKDLANVINTMFMKCQIDRMTDIKGNALEYYQKGSKDRKIGEFFTPRHLIDLIIGMTSPQISFKKENNEYVLDENGNRLIDYIEKIYDPACGSGGFLIQSFLSYLDKYRQYGVSQKNLKTNVVFGNELKDGTVMLTKLNMILLGDGHNHISNSNALGYKRIPRLEKIKNENGDFISVEEKNIGYREEILGDDRIYVPYDKSDEEPVIEQTSNVKYFLAQNKNGKLSKVKIDKKYVEIMPEEVFEEDNGEYKLYYKKDTSEPVIKSGTGLSTFYKAKRKMKKDEVTPEYDYIDVEPVNNVVRQYHNLFGEFDIVMANHPYGLSEPTKADELFVRHMIESVKSGGRIACIVGEQLLFDADYSNFREKLITDYTVEAIISLPQGVFNPYTDVKTSILFIKKEKSPCGHKTWLANIQSDGYELSLSRLPKEDSDLPKIKRLWERWGGYFIDNDNGGQEYRSFHKEEVGFAEFHKLDKKNWCVKRYNTPLISLNSIYNLVPIKSILKRNKTPIDIKDDETYNLVTIQVKNRGVVLRESLLGEEIGTKKQFKVKKGQFIISKIDARNGAYGIVPDELDGAIITGNFWTFDIDTTLVLPDFITHLMRHDFFNKMCNVCSYGSTNRWYLDEDAFNDFKIPLPTIDEQLDIFKEIKVHLDTIEEAKRIILKQEGEILSHINKVVG